MRVVFVSLWLMGREGIRAATRRRAALVHCLPLQVAECSTWNNALYVSPCLSLSSLFGEGVVLGARPYYCKPEEFLSKVIFCSPATRQLVNITLSLGLARGITKNKQTHDP